MAKTRHIHPIDRDPPEIVAHFYCKDPLVARKTKIGLGKVKIRAEPFLGQGPTTSRVVVVDYNADLDQTFAPVRVLDSGRGFAVGARNVRNLRFHQEHVWAVINRTLALIEDQRVLGRPIPWAFEGGRLLVLPHAGYWDNAYYDRETGALHFFYFEGKDGDPVYTCLSHDVVAHELGHAILDGLKPYYNEVSTPDAAGFHEYFGDAVAMVSALTQEEIAKAAVGHAPARLGSGVVSKLAAQFGLAVYGLASHDYLRNAENRMNMTKLRDNWEEHDYSLVLTGTFYDVLQRFYAFEVARLKKENKTTRRTASLCVEALTGAASHTRRVMLRALDYCPPAGITYLDYARAILRADTVAYPVDERRYRRMIRDILIRRRIASRPSELDKPSPLPNSKFRKYDIDTMAATPTDAYRFLDANREELNIPREVNFDMTSLYRTKKVSTDDYYPPREVVLEFVWSEDVRLSGSRFGSLNKTVMPLWCGGTLVCDSSGNVLHYVLKRSTPARRKRLQDYVAYLVEEQVIGIGDDGEEGLGARRLGTLPLTAVIRDGRLRLKRNAALQHAGRNRR